MRDAGEGVMPVLSRGEVAVLGTQGYTAPIVTRSQFRHGTVISERRLLAFGYWLRQLYPATKVLIPSNGPCQLPGTLKYNN